MSLTSFIVSRNWASSALRVLLTLAGVALGVAIVVAIYVMDHNTIESRRRGQDVQRGPVDLEVTPVDAARPAAQVVEALRGHAGVEAVAIWREARGAAIGAAGAEKPVDLAVFGMWPLPGAFAHYSVKEGRDLAAGDDDLAHPGVLLGSEAARALGARVGSTVRLAEPPALRRLECKDGKLVPIPMPEGARPFETDATVVGVLEDRLLGKRNQTEMAVVGLELANKLRPLGGNLYHVRREQGADLDRLRSELTSDFAVQDARAAMIGEGADERAFRNGLKVLGGLALLLGMFVVFQTLSHSLVARVRQLGLLRCLGAGTGAITRIFLADALLLGVIGSALGVGLGLLLALALQAASVSSLGLGKPWNTFLIPRFPVLWTAALGVLFTLAGAMFPLMRARQVPALHILQARGLAPGKDDGVDLLRGVHLWMFGLLVVALPLAYLAMTPLAAEESRETRIVLLELVGMLALFGSVLLLAPGVTALLGRALVWPCRAVFPLAAWLTGKVVARAAGRIAAAVCGLAAVLLALLGLKSLTASLEREVDRFAAQAIDGRAFVKCQPALPATVRELAQVPGVLRVDAFEGEERGGGFLLRGLAVEDAGASGGPLEGEARLVQRYVDSRARTLVVSKRLALAKHWQAGALVALRDKNGVPVSYEVLLVSDRAGFDGDERAFAIASPHWLRHDFCIADTCVENVTLHLATDADTGAIFAAARHLIPNVATTKTGAGIHAYLLRDVGRDFLLFDLLLAMMLVLAGVGLLNGMTIAALGRVRELGVLRALGTRSGSLCGSFLLEGAVVAALASLLALVLAVPLAWVLVGGMNQVARLEAPVALPWRWFVLAPLAAFATAVLAAIVPALRALRQSPAESVRYE